MYKMFLYTFLEVFSFLFEFKESRTSAQCTLVECDGNFVWPNTQYNFHDLQQTMLEKQDLEDIFYFIRSTMRVVSNKCNDFISSLCFFLKKVIWDSPYHIRCLHPSSIKDKIKNDLSIVGELELLDSRKERLWSQRNHAYKYN